MSNMDIEENSALIFSDEETEDYRTVKRRGTASTTSDASSMDSDSSDDDSLDWSDASVSEEESDDEEASEVELSPSEPWTDEPGEPLRLPFTGRPGFVTPIGNLTTPIEYFKLLFNINFLTYLAQATNAHAREVLARGSHKPQSRVHKWKDTCEEELLKFLGILFCMSNFRMDNISDYWAESPFFNFYFTDHMSRNRFLLILRMLYFKVETETSRLFGELDQLMNHFNDTMKSLIYPERNLTIGESLVLVGDRVSLRHFVKNKNQEVGVKLHVLADPKGLVHKIHVHKGSADTEVAENGHAKMIVLKLLDNYFDAGHSVYMDNFYNSVYLAEVLLSKKTYCTGTLLPNRKGNPMVVTSKRLSRGNLVSQRNNKGVCVMKWKDRRDVLTLSTEHTPELKLYVNRRGHVDKKPEMIIKHNTFMKGVDRHDEMLFSYPDDHKAFRWYKKFGIHIMQMMLFNAHSMYMAGTGNSISLDSFREKVLSSLLRPTSTPNPPQHPTHLIRELGRNENGVRIRRRCSRCWTKSKKRRDTSTYCQDCDLGLCISCYGPHHIENMLC